jgi:hypothetical protein
MSGKEVNKLLERATGEVIDPAAYWTDYGFRLDPWDSLVVPALRRIGVAEIVRRTDPSWRRAIQEYLRSGSSEPPTRRSSRRTDASCRRGRRGGVGC